MKYFHLPPHNPFSSGFTLSGFATVLVFLFFALSPVAASAERIYHKIALTQLPFQEEVDLSDARYQQRFPISQSLQVSATPLFPYVWIEGDGEAYIASGEETVLQTPLSPSTIFVGIASASRQKIRGILFYPLANQNDGFARLPFEIDPGKRPGVPREDFLHIKGTHYKRLTFGNLVGTAWFRRQWQNARPADAAEPSAAGNRIRNQGESELERTFNLFSGGRAIAENLALDESLDLENMTEESGQPVSEIRGITIQEYDWSELLDKTPPATDTLAKLIPSDQHGLFFHKASALNVFMQEWRKNGLPLFQMLQPAAVPAGLVERYERQLGLSLEKLQALPPDLGVSAIAITGGDPFFATGTDIAILLETSNPAKLFAWLEEEFRAIADRESDVQFLRSPEPENMLTITNPDRTRSTQAVAFENAVLLTNSPAQIDAVHRVTSGAQTSIADLDEYLFFRNRYPLSNDSETGFLLLSDETIRRWCGPEWRIGASRRLRAAALLSDQIARHLPALLAEENPQIPPLNANATKVLGDLAWTAAGPRSDRYGHLGFLTPIAELKIERATPAETNAYERWRNRYEGRWQRFFDPIAIRFSLTSDQIDADLTVMPLTASSEYRRVIELTGNREIVPGSGDPREDALVQAAVAVDPESEPMRQLAQMGQMFGTDFDFNPFAWMAGTVSFYVDDDFFWRALDHLSGSSGFVTENLSRIPAALHIDSKSPVQLALFLSGIRTIAEQSAPGMLQWETRKYKNQSYVAISPAETPSRENPRSQSFQIFYIARSDALVISPNEEVIHRSIDRFAKRRDEAVSQNTPWLGKHLNLSLQHNGMRVIQSLFQDNREARIRAAAQAPIPLLNDWKDRFPNENPTDLLRTFWHLDSDEFVWNDEYKTYESTRFGSPSTPRPALEISNLIRDFANLRLGIEFENDGIRARGILDRERAEPPAKTAISVNSTADSDAIETARYLPYREGAVWTHRHVYSHIRETALSTEKVVGKTPADDGERILVENRIERGEREPTKYRTWFSDTDGIRLHRSESEMSKQDMTIPQTILPARMKPGQIYHFKSEGTANTTGEPRSLHIEEEMILEGFESVEVEAGRFENCIRIKTKILHIEGGRLIPFYVKTTWYAPGVGNVKTRSEYEWGNSEIELISYRIPN